MSEGQEAVDTQISRLEWILGGGIIVGTLFALLLAWQGGMANVVGNLVQRWTS